MSFQAMAWAVKQECGGDPLAKLLLLMLANYADETGKAWPSIDRLARDTSMERKTVMRKTDTLIELGLLRKEQTTVKAITYNEYHLICQSLTGTGGPSQVPSQSLTGTGASPSGGPNPIKEPIKETKAKGVFVLEGTEAWEAWKKVRPRLLISHDQRGNRGQWLPSEFPPAKEQAA